MRGEALHVLKVLSRRARKSDGRMTRKLRLADPSHVQGLLGKLARAVPFASCVGDSREGRQEAPAVRVEQRWVMPCRPVERCCRLLRCLSVLWMLSQEDFRQPQVAVGVDSVATVLLLDLDRSSVPPLGGLKVSLSG